MEARSGRVIEQRGDEVLAVFADEGQAVRAAIELQATLAEEMAADSSLPLTVGVGIDAGEAVPVGEGYRGASLNMAARLCAPGVVVLVLSVSMAIVNHSRLSRLSAWRATCVTEQDGDRGRILLWQMALPAWHGWLRRPPPRRRIPGIRSSSEGVCDVQV